MKLGTKINLVLMGVIAVTLTIGFWVITAIEARNIKGQVTGDTDTITRLVQQDAGRVLAGSSAKQGISSDDVAHLQKIVDDAFSFGKTQKDATFGFFYDIIIFDKNLSTIVSSGSKLEDFSKDDAAYIKIRQDVLDGTSATAEYDRVLGGRGITVHVEPLSAEGGVMGVLETHNTQDAIQDRVNALRMRMLGVGIVFTAVLVIVLAIILERQVVGPIRRYSLVAQKVSEGDLKQQVEHTSHDEIGKFGEVFNQMVTNLRELDQLKSDFVSVAAHQLRTPLSGLNWVLKLFHDGDLGPTNESQAKMIDRGLEANQKMIVLVNDLLNVSRIEGSKFGYKFEKNDLAALLKTLTDNVALAAEEHKIEVKVEHQGAPFPAFVFDAENILLALQNIVDNSIKYTLPGGHVTITTKKSGEFAEIKISDTGVGIPKDEMSKLFSKFFRASNVIHLQTDGTGLGLFIAKNIIVRHGGQIWVESEERKGTTFTMLIPLNPELLPKGSAADGTTWKVQESETPVPPTVA